MVCVYLRAVNEERLFTCENEEVSIEATSGSGKGDPQVNRQTSRFDVHVRTNGLITWFADAVHRASIS